VIFEGLEGSGRPGARRRPRGASSSLTKLPERPGPGPRPGGEAAYGQGTSTPWRVHAIRTCDSAREEGREYVSRCFVARPAASAVGGLHGAGVLRRELRSSPLLLSLVCTTLQETGIGMLPRDA